MMIHNDLSKEIKLSQAIELALTSGKYTEASCYMCIALKRMGMEHHNAAIHDMVAAIHGKLTLYRDMPLICAANDAGLIDMGKMSNAEQNRYTTQCYCWWVFDLKRKGL